jgi:asparagine synthase (glutamine-hydrolysing)
MGGRLYEPDNGAFLPKIFSDIIQNYIEKGITALSCFSGTGALVLFDPKEDTCFIVTDRMCVYPLFLGQSGTESVICTHPDVLASCLKQTPQIDMTSVAEYIVTHQCTSPHTYYKNIINLDMSSVYQWDQTGFRKIQTYWKPEPKPDLSMTMDDFSHILSDGIRKSVRWRLNNEATKTGVLLSGGLDSRAILFSVPDPSSHFIAVTFCDRINKEVRAASHIASAAGVQHVVLKRDPEHYGKHAVLAAQIGAGTASFQGSHILGLLPDLFSLGPDFYLTALLMDMLFKGMPLEVCIKRRWGFWLNEERLASFRTDWGEPHQQIRNKELSDAVQERLKRFYDGIDTSYPSLHERMRVEFRRIFHPRFSDSCYSVRALPTDFILTDNHFCSLLEIMPPHIKLNDALMFRTLPLLSPEAAQVPDANTGLPPSASMLRRATYKLFQKITDRLPAKETLWTQGSWINWPYYYKTSPVIRNLWEDIRINSGDFIKDTLGYDVFQQPLSSLGANQFLVSRILITGLWYRYRIR